MSKNEHCHFTWSVYECTHTHTHTHTLSDPDLLSLLDGAHGVWLKLQLFRAAQFPVEDDNNEDDHKNWDHNSYDQPHVTGLSLRRRQGQLLHRWNRVAWYLAQKNSVLKHIFKVVTHQVSQNHSCWMSVNQVFAVCSAPLPLVRHSRWLCGRLSMLNWRWAEKKD